MGLQALGPDGLSGGGRPGGAVLEAQLRAGWGSGGLGGRRGGRPTAHWPSRVGGRGRFGVWAGC